jgi:hypothetical protein
MSVCRQRNEHSLELRAGPRIVMRRALSLTGVCGALSIMRVAGRSWDETSQIFMHRFQGVRIDSANRSDVCGSLASRRCWADCRDRAIGAGILVPPFDATRDSAHHEQPGKNLSSGKKIVGSLARSRCLSAACCSPTRGSPSSSTGSTSCGTTPSTVRVSTLSVVALSFGKPLQRLMCLTQRSLAWSCCGSAWCG